MAEQPRRKQQALIRDYDKFTRSLRCFDWNDPSIPGAMDLDRVLERKGRFLVWELKDRVGPKVFVPLGQFITLRTLSQLPQFDVYLIAETPDAKASSKERYAYARMSELKGDFEVVHSGSRCVGIFIDKRFTRSTLAGLQRLERDWWKQQSTNEKKSA